MTNTFPLCCQHRARKYASSFPPKQLTHSVTNMNLRSKPSVDAKHIANVNIQTR